MATSGRVFCGRCGTANTAGARFCSHCGSALAAAAAPVTAAPPPPPPAYAPTARYAYAMASPQQAHAAFAGRHSRLPWFLAGGGVLLLIVIFAVIAAASGPKPAESCTSPVCSKKPPTGRPLGAQHTFTSSANGWHLDWYDIQGAPFTTQSDASGIQFVENVQGIGFPILVTSERVNGKSADQVVSAIQQGKFGSAQQLYTVPNVLVGVDPGYANVYSVTLRTGNGASVDARLIVGAAIRDKVAIEFVAIGPFKKSTPNDGHPNPSNSWISGDTDAILKGVYFEGEPAR